MSERLIIDNQAATTADRDAKAVAQQSGSSIPEDEGLTLLDVLIILAKYKRVLIGLPIAVAIIAAAYSLTLPNTYTASTQILPPQNTQSVAASMLAQFGNVPGFGLKSSNDVYIAMLKSRTLADGVIERLDLNTAFQQKAQSGTRATLAGMTNIRLGKDATITVEVDDQDSGRASVIANAYVDELIELTNVLAVTEASQRRLFFEKQLTQAKDELAKAELLAQQSLARSGVVQVEGQGRAMLEATARLRGQITVKEVQIGAMGAFASEQNPELVAAHQELAAMKRELAKLEGVDRVRVTGKTPVGGDRALDSLSLLRDLKYKETVYELLIKQYQIAKIDEAKDGGVIQVLDKAIPPDRKSKPKRSLIVFVAGLAGVFLAVLWAFVREALSSVDRDPRQSERLRMLKRYLAWR